MGNYHIQIPIISPVPRSDDTYQLINKLTEYATIAGIEYRISIDAGFRTDVASIPRACWRIIGHPLQGLAMPAAVTHDGLYAAEAVTRDVADAIFRDLMVRNGVNRAKAWTMWAAVRTFGWLVWRSHTSRSIATARTKVTVSQIKHSHA